MSSFYLPPVPDTRPGTPYPAEYWAEVTRIVVEALAAGVPTRSLFAGGPDSGLPSRAKWWDWLNARGNESELSRYRRARELAADSWAEEVVTISDTAVDADTAAAARVRADARKWAASKFNAAQYGDQVGLTLGGNGGITINLQRFQPSAAPQLSGPSPVTIEGASSPGEGLEGE